MRDAIVAAVAIAGLFAAGCESSATKHAAAAAQVLQTGNASIEDFHSGANIGIGEVGRICHVYDIDGVFVAKGRVNGVFTLTPGHHVVTVYAAFTHITGVLATRSIDAGQVDIPIEATSAQRYTITGREFERDTAEVWFKNLGSGADASEHKAFQLDTTVQPQNTLLIIPIPIR